VAARAAAPAARAEAIAAADGRRKAGRRKAAPATVVNRKGGAKASPFFTRLTTVQQIPLGVAASRTAVGHGRCRLGGMKHHEHYTELEQDQLDWISRFADRLRLMQPQFAEERASQQASEIAAIAWERPDWRALAPEDAADRWLREQPVP